MNFYKVYGITLKSEIELPELIRVEANKPDASLYIGPIPQSIPEPVKEGVLFQAARNDFLLRLDQVGAIRVQNGSTITVDPNSTSTAEQIRLFVLGSAMGALLHQKEIMAIHSSAVATHKGALVLSGKSSSGKSTLAASLVKKGYKFIADDIAALHQIGGKFIVHHGIPSFKLWKDVLEKMVITKNLCKISPSIEKYRNPVEEKLHSDPLPLYKIIILSSKNSDGIEIKELRGVEKFETLYANTYRQQYIDGLQKNEVHFKSITNLAKTVPVYRVLRPSSPLLIEELTNFIISEI